MFAFVAAIGSASREGLNTAETVGYLIGTIALPFALMIGGRAIYCSVVKNTAPVADLPWIVLGAGIIALLSAAGNAGKDVDDDGAVRNPAIRVEVVQRVDGLDADGRSAPG